ncbi:curlin [Devosia sp. BSSL-BM10]|jgi:hypothetical protein|uniref:Curlin n=1 Tax=Devosia litorisediminis TaxID=2829817 RepID=A0A942E9A1_9HYPH|nr:curlin [Devosia litorisediminis]MBS3847902.1 curlin [Devosia litorisediminis]
MTTKLFKTLAIATTALIISAASLSTPAMAGGQFSLSFAPQNSEHQQVLGLGLLMLSLVNGASEGGANVRQNGNHNTAGVDQRGRNNNGLIVQDGNGHHGTIEQRGNNNNCALLQFGENTRGRCAQFGNNQTGITTVFGF